MKSYIKQDFESHLGETFSLSTSASNIDFTLQEIVEEKISQPQPKSRLSFSLFFTTPVANQINQGMYQLKHSAFDDLNIFLVPVEQRGTDENALICYQALFN